MPAIRLEITRRDPHSAARTAVLHTPSGPIDTPAFAPVGTQATVKGMTPRDLRALGVQLVMSNAYHLAMRPGADVVAALGGLHTFSGWDGPLMTDSGGYQVFSLEGLREVDDDGVTFQSHVDGRTQRFTPESVVALQETLGADLAMPLDVCTGYPATREAATADLARTHDWAARALLAHERPDQALYGIVQGSTYPELRAESARHLAALGFPAYAIGGVSVGEPKDDMARAVAASVPELPEDAPRHLLGVGHPEDIVVAVAGGIDTFDCVVPTRYARNAGALTMAGRINMRNAEHTSEPGPIEQGCTCYACQHFTRGAVRHWLKAGEILGLHLLTIHNLHFVLRLMRDIRRALADGTFDTLRQQFLEHYADGAYAPSVGPPEGASSPAAG